MQRHVPYALLVRADSIMQSMPDSALRILEAINPYELKEKDNQAYYALLLTQARDKNYIVQTDDSLIRIAVDHYNFTGDVHKQAKAYFYLGCVYRDANQSGKAIKEFLTAIPLAEKTIDARLTGLLYINTGYLYFQQNLLTQADSIFQMAERMFIQRKDTSLWAEALSYQGQINIEKGTEYYPKAEQNLLTAFKMTETLKYRQIHASITASLSSLYSRMKEKEKAIQFAKLNIALREDSIHRYRAYFLLGDAYFKSGLYDSATIYVNKSLAQPGYRTKAGAYMRLAEIAKRQGKINQSLIFTEQYTLYMDSMHLAQQGHDILKAETEIEKWKYANTVEKNNNKQFILITVSALLVVAIGVIYVKLKKNRSKTREMEEYQTFLEQEQQKLHQELTRLKDEITQKDDIAASIRRQIALQDMDEKSRKELLDVLGIVIKERQHLVDERDAVTKTKDVLAKEAFEHSNVYEKIERIIKAHKENSKVEEKLNEEDWSELISLTNKHWEDVIQHLIDRKDFEKKEIHLCCLLMTDLPIANLTYLLDYARASIYRKEEEILVRLGYSKEEYKLKDILKNT